MAFGGGDVTLTLIHARALQRLWHAASGGDVENLKKLLRQGANFDWRNPDWVRGGPEA